MPTQSAGPSIARIPTAALWARYRDLRVEAEREQRRSAHTPEALELLRQTVAEWAAEGDLLPAEQPSDISRHRIRAKVLGLTALLSRFPEFVSEAELAATEQFLEMAFAVHEDPSPTLVKATRPGGAGFAFIVQMRLSAHNEDYAGELVPLVPAMHYVPPRLREAMMLGIPPYVADTYHLDGQIGHLIVAPIFDCDARRKSRTHFVRDSRRTVQDAIALAQRLGASVIGLGGMLPSLTRYGQAIDAGDAILTTGHGGTISLVAANIERALNRADAASDPVLGILGLGSIGQAIAHEVIARYNHQLPVMVCDREPNARRRFAKSVRDLPGGNRVEIEADAADLIRRATTVVSAVAGRIDLDADLALSPLQLRDRSFIDDSQPYSLPPHQITDRGGSITWVVGHTGPRISRNWYDYGTMADRHHDVFGCEAEAASLAAELNTRVAAGLSPQDAFRQIEALAVRHAATGRDVANMTELFNHHEIGLAQPQTFKAPPAEYSPILCW